MDIETYFAKIKGLLVALKYEGIFGKMNSSTGLLKWRGVKDVRGDVDKIFTFLCIELLG